MVFLKFKALSMRLMNLRGLFSRLQGTNYQVEAIVYCVAGLLYCWSKTLTFTAILFLINEECLMFWGVFWHLYASDDQILRRTPDEVMTWASSGGTAAVNTWSCRWTSITA